MAKKKDTTPKPSKKPVSIAEFLEATEQTEEEHYVISASNSNGGTIRERFSCMPYIETQCLEILNSKKFPFRNKSDIYRWAVHYGLAELLDREPVVHSIMREVEGINILMQRTIFAQDFGSTFSNLTKVVRNLKGEDAIDEARRLCRMIQQKIAKLAPGYWRDKYVSRLESEFGDLLPHDKNGIKWPKTFGHKDIGA